MRKLSVVLFICMILGLTMGFTDCNGASTSNQTSVSGASQASPITVAKNSRGLTCEQQNIQDRIKVTSDPTKVMWIHLIALDGKDYQADARSQQGHELWQAAGAEYRGRSQWRVQVWRISQIQRVLYS